LDIDTGELTELKQEISKTFEDVHRYESKLSSKGDTFKLKGLAELEQSLDTTVSNIASQMEQFDRLSFDTPTRALGELRESVKQLGAEIRTDKSDIKDITKALEEAQSDIKKGQEEVNAIIKERNRLEREYTKNIGKVSPEEKGSKSRLNELEKEHELALKSLNERENAANTLINVGKYNLEANKEALDVANNKLNTDEQDIAQLRSQRDEMYNIVRSEKRTNEYIEERIARMKELNTEILKQKDAILSGSGAAREKLEEDANKTGVSYHSKYEEAILKQKAEAAKEAARIEHESEKEAARAAREHEASIKREIAAVKQSAGQYYYKLRAVKMFGFILNNVSTGLDNFGKKMVNSAKRGLSAYAKLIPGVNALSKAFSRASNSQRAFNKELGKTHKSHEDFKQSLGDAVKMFLKYGLGIRSLFVLFNRFRATVTDGLGQLSQKYSEVNQQMSSVVSSMNQMKAAVTSVVQPLLNVLAPALEKIAAIVADIAYKVASFIAALTGQSFVFKATRQQVDYAKSLDKTAKAAKKANKELGKYDKLNVIQKNKDSGKDDGGVGAMGFEKVPIDSTMAKWADKFKKFLDRLLGPIKKAWDKMKDFVKKGWKYALDELLKLGKSVARDFWRVWEEPETQKIFENIFKVIGDIGFIVGNLAKNFRIAWDTCENGYRILKAIRDIILIISEGAVQIADYMVIWSENLSFIPLLTTLADVMEQKLVPAVQKVVDLFVYLFNEIILKIVKDFIESGLPQVIRIAGNLVEAIGNIAENLRNALKDGDKGVEIVTKVEDLVQIVANYIEKASEKTAEWAKNLNFTPLLESASRFLDKMKPVIDFIASTLEKLWDKVLLPFWQYLIEEGFPKLLDMLGELSDSVDWEDLKSKVDKFLETFEKFLELGWETLIEVIRKLGEAFIKFINSNAFQKMVDLFKGIVDRGDPETLANWILGLSGVFLAAKGVINGFNAVFTIMIAKMTLSNLIMQGQMIKSVKALTTALGSGEVIAGGAAAGAGGTGLVGALAAVGTALAVIAGLFMDVQAAMEVFRLNGLKKMQDEMPQTASATNGMTEEMNGLEKVFKKVWEIFHPGETLADDIIVESDYEKLENMRDELYHMGSAMENAGTLSKDAGQKISDAIDIWIEHGERMEDLSDEEVKQFVELYQSVEDYYNKVKDNKEPIAAIERLEGHWWDLQESAPNAEDGAEQGSAYITGFTESIEETDLTATGANMIAGVTSGAEEELNATDTTSWWQKILQSFKDFFKIHSPSVVMEEEGIFLMTGLFNGIDKLIPNIIKQITKFGETILTTVKDAWRNMISETQRSWNTLKSNVTTYARDVVSKFKSEFSASKLISVGRNFMNGLIDGIKQKASSLMSTIGDVCSDAVNAVKSAFQIHSPSRVMREIGQYIIEGLAIGVDDEADKNLIPLDFMDTFLAALTNMSLDAVDIVTAMIDEIDTRLSNIAFMENFNSQLNKISAIKVPDIAVGSALPSNIKFRQSSVALDEKTLNRLIREAVGDIVSSINTDSNKAPIMLQLDSRTVAEAVWDEEEKRYKQRGDYKPFYT
jgi:uncharacterized protein YoxC